MPGSSEDLAYDGSNEPQKQELTARERDIITRILGDILSPWANGVRLSKDELPILAQIRRVIDPRKD